MPRLLIDAVQVCARPKGVGRYAYHACLQLAARLPDDWSLHVLIYPDEARVFPAGFRGELIGVERSSEIGRAIFQLRKSVSTVRPDIMLKTEDSAGCVASLPTVIVCHDIDELLVNAQGEQRSLARRLIDDAKHYLRRRALRSGDFIVCNSQFTRDAVHRYYGVPHEKMAVGYCAVDPRFYELSPQGDKKKTLARYGLQNFVLAFATGDPRENHRRLPAVAAKLRDLQVPTCLVIGGVRPGPYVAELRAEFQRSNLVEGKNFILQDFLPDAQFRELAELYAAADFYLDLSLHEGFGMQLAEAMACGTTCISSPNGALAEIGDGHVVFVDPTQVDSIAAAVKTSYEHKLHLRNNQEQIRYTRKFSWDEMGKVVTGALMRIANGAGKHAA